MAEAPDKDYSMMKISDTTKIIVADVSGPSEINIKNCTYCNFYFNCNDNLISIINTVNFIVFIRPLYTVLFFQVIAHRPQSSRTATTRRPHPGRATLCPPGLLLSAIPTPAYPQAPCFLLRHYHASRASAMARGSESSGTGSSGTGRGTGEREIGIGGTGTGGRGIRETEERGIRETGERGNSL